METLCFLSADLLLGDSDYAANTPVKTMVPLLLDYRDAYRTNRAEWSPVEEDLQMLLSRN